MPLNRLRPFLCALLLVASLSLLLWARPATTRAKERAGRSSESSDASAMPKQCRPGKTSTQTLGWRWRPNTRVHVYYLKNSFSGAEVGALSRAVSNWNKALVEMDFHIAFAFGGERPDISEDNATITVMRGIPKGKERLGEIKFYSMSNGVNRMLVIISPVVTDLDALTSLMAHEIGHSLGLADCYGCRRGTTTMAAFKDDNKGNDVYEPSECDRYVVAAGYMDEISARARAATATRR